MRKMPKEYIEDLRWAREHHSELLKKYSDQWIAVVNRNVVAAGKNLEKVEQEAKSKTGMDDVPVMFVECGEHIYGL